MEEAIRFRITKTPGESIMVEIKENEKFYPFLHYHPEMQLTLVVKGSGNRMTGDSVGYFKPGDIYLIGANIPHYFRLTEEYEKATSISVYFPQNILGNEFGSLPELANVGALIRRAEYAIKFSGPDMEGLRKRMTELSRYSDLKRVTVFLELLDSLAKSPQSTSLSGRSFPVPESDKDGKRTNDVFSYLFSSYKDNIRLSEVASVANLSPNAFCRYFKKRTGKTLITVVNEIRINEACRLLIKNDLPVGDIAFMVGFRNVSTFNHKFREVMGVSPGDFRKNQTVFSEDAEMQHAG